MAKNKKKSWKSDPKKYIVNEWGEKEMTIDERLKRLNKKETANKILKEGYKIKWNAKKDNWVKGKKKY